MHLYIKNSAISILTCLMTGMLHAQPIELKGIYIGIDKEKLELIYDGTSKFTIAEVPAYDNWPLNLSYNDGKLEELNFFFVSSSFEKVRYAILKKYPKLKCNTSKLQNRFGASFDQVRCLHSDENSQLTLVKFVDLDTSAVVLKSKKKIQNEKKSIENEINDI